MATYSLQGPEADKVQILIHADVGSDYSASRTVSLGYLITDENGRLVDSQMANARLQPVMNGVPSALQYAGGASLPAGLQRLRDVGFGFCGRDVGSRCGIGRHLDRTTQFTHHLHRDRHALSHEQSRIGLRPCEFRYQMAVVGEQAGINLLRQMRHHRAAQACQHFHGFPPGPGEARFRGGTFGIGDGIGQFIQPSDCDVEREPL